MVIQDLVVGIKKMIKEENYSNLSLGLLIVSENYANDKYILNLLLRKTDGVEHQSVITQREYIKHLLSYL